VLNDNGKLEVGELIKLMKLNYLID